MSMIARNVLHIAGIAFIGITGIIRESFAQFNYRFETGEQVVAAAEADQAVAVDDAFIYAIDNHRIGKYEKTTGKKVDEWVGAEDGPVIHLNSGIVINDTLYCAHSNFPGVPMTGSIEMWSVDTMEHVGSRSFGVYRGSATWVDWYGGRWWVAFAHYSRNGGVPGKGPEWTQLTSFSEDWRPLESWVFPEEVVRRFCPNSNSGGAWGPEGVMYVTGHDAAEVYVMKLPKAGSTLVLEDILAFPGHGQGIAWDPSDPTMLYGIRRDSHTVVSARLVPVSGE